MTKTALTINEVKTIINSAGNLRYMPALAIDKSVCLQRTFKNAEKALKDFQEELKLATDKYNTSIKDLDNTKDEDAKKIEKLKEKYLADIETMQKQTVEVEVHYLKVADFPKTATEFGTKDWVQELGAGKGKSLMTMNYYDFFIDLYDLLILEDADYKLKVPAKK